ncbi:PIR Superfamily Protein [Plasmodium ovale wallikeri]|uniref:PIR Superfamily Protein n=1 Tax=Plasmodium ovale wallikeri TaxID=864142 RepID=A0A1A9ATM8_PLAOA|nr:PIR Superfamily Protein [Plasmodium ovale wallikeri]SBT59482.1 PIR Superfamily Protein [Plasmodium ovale wallikeri]
MDEAENILKELSKYKLYNKLNQVVDQNEYSYYCADLNYMDRIYEGFTNLCYIFAKNLINLHDILSDVTGNDERCNYFNFWITDLVRKKWKNEWKDKPRILYTLQVLYGVENTITDASQKNNCRFDYSSNIDLDLWNERKCLYDYIENYNDIEVKINYDGQLCKIYSKYFDHIKKLHDKYKGECCNGYSPKCFNLMKLDYLCTTDRFNNKLQCDESNGVAADRTEDDTARDMGELGESGRFHSALPASLEPDIHANGDLLSNNTDYYAKIGGSFTFMGILSTFLYFYKFTTFGTWIRSKIVKNKINDIIDDEAQNSNAHELNNMNESFYNDGYNLTYHAS